MWTSAQKQKSGKKSCAGFSSRHGLTPEDICDVMQCKGSFGGSSKQRKISFAAHCVICQLFLDHRVGASGWAPYSASSQFISQNILFETSGHLSLLSKVSLIICWFGVLRSKAPVLESGERVSRFAEVPSLHAAGSYNCTEKGNGEYLSSEHPQIHVPAKEPQEKKKKEDMDK